MRPLTSLSSLFLLLWPAALMLASCDADESDGGNVGGAMANACGAEGSVEFCYTGPPTTRGLGVCEDGTRTCRAGEWSPCEDEVLPEAAETCDDGIDQTCNGIADEGCHCTEGETQRCYSGPATTLNVGTCREGSQQCEDGSWSQACVGQVLPVDVEPCDGEDHTCNGMPDEGCSCQNGASRPCYTGAEGTEGQGVCHGGEQSCEAGVWPSACAGEVIPGPESCNGADDNCDTATDEGDPGSGGSCTTSECGACAAGTYHCVGGSLQCQPNQSGSNEICDGVDNNCNCQTDEGDPGGGGGCNTGQCGVCAAGTYHCSGGSLQCQQIQSGTSEVCDGVDNNCNCQTDEGDPGGGGACSTGLCGVCAAGTRHCVAGSLQCQQNQSSTGEVCDGVDNNCNCQTDEGDPGGGGACTTGGCGVCAAGTYHCSGGSIGCFQNQGATGEVCDGVDNDCNCQTDEGSLCTYHYCCVSGGCQWCCPYVYAYDGRGYVCETSVGGSGMPRESSGRRAPWPFRPMLAKLESARVIWRPALAAGEAPTGTVRSLLLAAEDEIVYLRRAKLAVVEHPVGYEIFSSTTADWRVARRADPQELLALRSDALRAPCRASWLGRDDVTAAISVRNDEPVAFDRSQPNWYELDFGRVGKPESARLVIDGWKFLERRQLGLCYQMRPPRLQVEQLDGSWRDAIVVPSPRGDRKAVVVDLGGIDWPTDRYRMRLWTGTHQWGQAMWYLDRVRLTEDPPATVRAESFEADEAILRHFGPPRLFAPDDPSRPRLSVPDGRGECVGSHETTGLLTRYGSVRELVRTADDRLVVMERGDGVELRFDAVPAAGAGLCQTFFLDVELIYKPRLPVGERPDSSDGQSVEPLPYAERPDGGLPDALAHQRYLREVQTRRPGEGAEVARGRTRALG